MIFVRQIAATAVLAVISSSGLSFTQTSASNQQNATQQLAEFVEAYRSEDYRAQWQLMDPRKRRWIGLERWRKAMTQSRRRHGALTSWSISEQARVEAEQLPCTEMGHCYRKGVDYHVYILRTTYATKQVAQPEFIVMSLSKEGWRFAGGTFPATALGETAVLLDEVDEKRFLAIKRARKTL